MLDEREALGKAQDAEQFHRDALSAAEADRTELQGPWGVLTRLTKTHTSRLAAIESHIQFHAAKANQFQAEAAQISESLQRREETRRVSDTKPSPSQLDDVAQRMRDASHPQLPDLVSIESAIAEHDKAHADNARLHRLGVRMLGAVRGKTTSNADFLTRKAAAILTGQIDTQTVVAEFAAQARNGGHVFEPTLGEESLIAQAEAILSPLRDDAIEHTRDHRVLEMKRSDLLTAVAKSPFGTQSPDVVPSGKSE